MVHGQSVRLCQWTGEPLKYPPFRIPVKGAQEFKGCYGSPSVCVSAIVELAEKEGRTPEESHELLDTFQSTLIRKSGQEEVKFTINPAPSWKNLKEWGGNTTLEEYHKSYDHDQEVLIFTQTIPSHMILGTVIGDSKALATEPSVHPPATSSFEYDSDPERATNAPKRWWVNFLNSTPSMKEPVEKRVQMPRCISSCVEFLRGSFPGHSSVVVYLHPESDKTFGIGLPGDWMGQGNKRASDVLGKTPVYGNVFLYHKNKMKLRPPTKKRTREEAGLPIEQKDK